MKYLFLIVASVASATALTTFEGISRRNGGCNPPCPPPLFCLNFPVAGAGAACVGPPPEPCTPGTPSRCVTGGYEACVNGYWAFTACPAPLFCLNIPVQGAGVACVGPP